METHCFYLDLVKLRKAKIMREHIVENRNSNKLKNKTGKKKKEKEKENKLLGNSESEHHSTCT